MGECIIRPAAEKDAAAIAEIYNHYITTSTVTFDTVLKTVEDRQAWITEHGPRHPAVVAIDATGRVLAWGALSPHATRPAWSATVEVAVYVAPDERGNRVGSKLLEHLIALAREAGHHAMLSQIVATNTVSIRMTERAGFVQAGYLREVGYKFDKWLDVTIMQLIL